MKKKIFIDGSAGTTGLRIAERLAARPELELISLPESLRKDPAARKAALNAADAAFLCLPDDAAREAVALLENPDTVVLDTSTAHRTAEGWVYGFPELVGHEAVARAKRIAVPGCHASGFIALIAPLVRVGLLAPDTPLVCHSVTGYSGGGKKMIAQYRDAARGALLDAPRQYGLSQNHKHLPEMTALTGLTRTPVFCPVVSDFYSGMCVTVPLFAHQLRGSREDVAALYRGKYAGPVVFFRERADEEGFLSAGALSGKDGMEISLAGNDERILLTARYDNLGKGASGAAVQCLNLVFGLEEREGLEL